jgi:hypothetical protein
MDNRTRHVSERIERPATEVYEWVRDPAHLPDWAPGLGTSVEQVDGHWYVETGMGRVRIAFAQRNDYGVLDHVVTTASGETFSNPMRVVAYGSGCEVVFSVRRQPGVTDEEFDRDVGLVAADLARLRELLQSG